jgi:DNA-binding transcriptional regulator YhcF (GntR family)
MKIQERTYERILINLFAVEAMFKKDKTEYDKEDFKEVSQATGISVSRVKRAYENLSEFGFVNLSLGDLSNARVVPNKPVIQRRVTRRRATNTYIKRKDEGYVNAAKHIIHDRIFTNMTVKEIAEKWNCSKGRVNSLISEVARHGAIKLPKFKKHVLIDIGKYRDVNIRDTIDAIKEGFEFDYSLEKELRHKLLTRVLREALSFNE